MKQPTIIIARFENRELFHQALDEWNKHKKQIPNLKDEVYSFAYWLFRYNGLEIRRIKDEDK